MDHKTVGKLEDARTAHDAEVAAATVAAAAAEVTAAAEATAAAVAEKAAAAAEDTESATANAAAQQLQVCALPITRVTPSWCTSPVVADKHRSRFSDLKSRDEKMKTMHDQLYGKLCTVSLPCTW